MSVAGSQLPANPLSEFKSSNNSQAPAQGVTLQIGPRKMPQETLGCLELKPRT